MDIEHICKELEALVRNELDLRQTMEDDAILEVIDQAILEQTKKEYIPLPMKITIREHVFHALRGYDCLEELLKRNDISEIMINGYQTIFIEKHGKLMRWKQGFSSEEKYMDVIQQVVAGCNRIVNESTPIVDARLADGSRVNVVLPPIALDGAIMTIRRFPEQTYSLDDLEELKMLSGEMKAVLALFVKSKYNIMISGGTGAGKTTFLNALATQIAPEERIITIEDSAELQIKGIPNLVRMEARNANVEGKNEIPIKVLIRSALRMRPDRIIVGEVRGEEALDMLQAMNTGHSGSLSTGHANSGMDMLYRLETMVLMGVDLPLLAIRQQIASALDIIIHIGRIRDGSRKVLEIQEVLGMQDGEIKLHTLYQWEEQEWRRFHYIKQSRKLEEMGYLEAYRSLYDS